MSYIGPITQEQQTAFYDAFMRWFKGDVHAVHFCLDMLRVAHLWDDLIDGDRQPSVEEVDAGFSALLFRLPRNPFYRVHIDGLLPLMQSTFLQWHTANVLEREQQPGDLPKAY